MQTWDFIVVGGGPAGLSAALVASGNQVATLVLESRDRLGGQVHWADHPIVDLLGQPAGSGAALADSFQEQIARSGLAVRTSTSVSAIRAHQDSVEIRLSGGEVLTARRILLATGLRRRKLGVPGEPLAEARTSPRREAKRFAGRKVVVVGGGDEAADTARTLAEAGAEVELIVRARLSARPLFARPLRKLDGVEIREGEQIAALIGSDAIEAVELDSGLRLPCEACYIRIGAEPRWPELDPAPRTQVDGRIWTNGHGRSSVPVVFAAGDIVRGPGERFISVALGDGAIVARAVEADLQPT